jgi:hypothetical protein
LEWQIEVNRCKEACVLKLKRFKIAWVRNKMQQYGLS